MSDADSVSYSAPRRPSPPVAAEASQPPKRARRAAAFGAMHNLAADPKSLLEAIKDIKASADIAPVVIDISEEGNDEEEGEGSRNPHDALARAQDFSKRMEEEVNRLKNCAQDDKRIIESLKATITNVLQQQQESRPRQQGAAAASPSSSSASTTTFASIAAMFVSERMAHDATKALLARANGRLGDMHAAFVPQCGICQDRKPTISLHEGTIEHRFCIECITTYASQNRILLARQGYLDCPLCKARFSKIPSFDIQSLSTADLNTWLLSNEAQRDSTFYLRDLRPEQQTQVLSQFLSDAGVTLDAKTQVLTTNASCDRVVDALVRCVSRVNQLNHDEVPDT